MKLAELVNEYYQDLNENDIYIWNYIDHHRKECEHLAIDELAMRTHVSRTTVLRFAQKLSLTGYGELKVHLKWENGDIKEESRYLDQIVRIYESIIETMSKKDLHSIFARIEKAKAIYVYGSGAVQSAFASEMKRIFQTSGKFIYTISASDEADTISTIINEEDLVFVISLSGESNHVKDFARKLKIKNVPIISITKEKENTLAHLSDENLYITTMYADLGNSRIPFEASTSFFILLEMLYLRYLEYVEGEEQRCQ